MTEFQQSVVLWFVTLTFFLGCSGCVEIAHTVIAVIVK